MILLELFWTFFKIGAFTFGGGYAMLPLIQAEVVAHQWMSDAELVNFVAVSESTPGPFAVNIATYVGSEVGGVLGSVCATLGVVLPSFLIILLVATCFEKFRRNRIVKGCMSGLKPAVIGMIGAALLSVAGTVFVSQGFSTALFSDPLTYVSLGIFLLAAVLAFKKKHPIFIICLAAILGVATGYLFA
ncbi:MAG: chromate transporter [Clostridia bacterium]|nr:chromate transporter [Clostridia bacterium]